MVRSSRIAVPVSIACLFAFAVRSSAAEIALSFEADAVVVDNATPGGKVVIFSVGQETVPWSSRFVRRAEVLQDEDGDGSLRYPVSDRVPYASVWSAVDLASGALAIRTPPGSPFQESRFPANALIAGKAADALRHTHSAIDAVLVRPGVAAWLMSTHDGDPDDADGETDGHATLDLSSLQPLDDSPPGPTRYMPGDVLVAMDLYRHRFFAAQLAGGR